MWKFVASDNFNLDKLMHFKDFYESDLVSAQAEVAKHMTLQKYGLPGWRTGLVRRQIGVEEAEFNLEKVNEAIKIYNKKHDSK
jgi:hypothetical protein